jgi:hypothetical protein
MAGRIVSGRGLATRVGSCARCWAPSVATATTANPAIRNPRPVIRNPVRSPVRNPIRNPILNPIRNPQSTIRNVVMVVKPPISSGADCIEC